MKRIIYTFLLSVFSSFIFGQSVMIAPTNDEILVTRYNSTPNMLGRNAGGVNTSPTATPANSGLLSIAGRGYVAGWLSSNNVAINLNASENFTSTARGTYMTFNTTSNGNISMSERMRINNNGFIGVGTSSPSSTLHVSGGSAGVQPVAFTLGTFENDGAVGLSLLSSPSLTSFINFGSSLGNKCRISYTPAYDELSFVTNSISRLRIEDDGEVELGDDTYPGVRIFPDGNGSSGEITLYKNGTTNAAIWITGSQGAGRGAIMSLRNSTTTSSIIIDADYNNTDRGRVITDELEIRGGSDLAEYFTPFMKEKILEGGTVVSVSNSGKGDIIASTSAYDKKVVGVVSGANGIKTGLMLRQAESIADGDIPVALSGRVYVKTIGEVKAGDFLTTSDVEGYAMKAKNLRKAKGAIIGKALTNSTGNDSLILVLLNAK